MFKIKETKDVIVIEIDGTEMCWYHADYGRKDLKKKLRELKERGLVEL